MDCPLGIILFEECSCASKNDCQGLQICMLTNDIPVCYANFIFEGIITEEYEPCINSTTLEIVLASKDQYCLQGKVFEYCLRKSVASLIEQCYWKDKNGKVIFCEPGYVLDIADSTCKECGSSTGLDQDLLYAGQFKCVPCEGMCMQCIENYKICTTCKPGAYMMNNECFPCAENCGQCDSIDVCSKCAKNYYMNENQECMPCHKSCSECTGPENEQCMDNSCKINYYSEGENGGGFPVCLGTKCAYFCSKCSENNNPAECLDCISGYGFALDANKEGDYCYPCMPHCEYCLGDITECYDCDIGYYLKQSADGISCQPCFTGCLMCNGFDNFNCTSKSCTNDYYLGDLNGEEMCFGKICDKSCLQCVKNNDNTQCATCNYYYGRNTRYRSQSKYDIQCLPCGPNCEECFDDHRICEVCDEHYKMTAGRECVKRKRTYIALIVWSIAIVILIIPMAVCMLSRSLKKQKRPSNEELGQK